VGDGDVVQGEAELRVKETMATNGARSAGEVEDVQDACSRNKTARACARPCEASWRKRGMEQGGQEQSELGEQTVSSGKCEREERQQTRGKRC
jgi:hypothetical protein